MIAAGKMDSTEVQFGGKWTSLDRVEAVVMSYLCPQVGWRQMDD